MGVIGVCNALEMTPTWFKQPVPLGGVVGTLPQQGAYLLSVGQRPCTVAQGPARRKIRSVAQGIRERKAEGVTLDLKSDPLRK